MKAHSGTPIVGGMITSTIHVLILVPVFFAFMKEHVLRRGTLRTPTDTAKSRSVRSSCQPLDASTLTFFLIT